MGQINVDFEELDTNIEKLANLKTEIEGISIDQPTQSGSGSTAEQMAEAAEAFEAARQALATLVGKSVEFFQGVKQSYQDADTEASRALAGE